MATSWPRFALTLACFTVCLNFPKPSHAVPAFAGQTGQPCITCHVGGFGPELTQFGRQFKISGYTMQGGSGTLAHFPFALFVQTSFTSTSKGQGGPAAPDFAANNNFALDQVSLFLAGRLTDYAGGFIQATYDGIGHNFFSDNTDLRLTTPVQIAKHDAQIGLSLNNGPMVQDPYNTTYAWNFPFFSSGLAPTPAATTVLGGPLLGNTLGLTGYAFVDSSLYVEAGGYDTQAPGLMSRLGEAYGPGSATGAMPYVRLAYEWNWGDNSAHIGTAFFHGRFNTATDAFSATGSLGHDRFTDAYLDAGYQYLSSSGRDTFTLNGFYNHEDRTLQGTQAAGGATSPNGTLEETRLTATYYFEHTYGATLAWERLWGSADPLLYQQGTPIAGSASGSPNSNAFILEADWVPFGKEKSWLRPLANLKLGAQYTIYTEFNGGSRNYDGFGRNASDNNTLFLYAWFCF
jgi:hypothetical protein